MPQEPPTSSPSSRARARVAAGAGEGTAGTDAGDEVGDPAIGLLPDLRAGGLVVRPGIVRVGVLVRLPCAGDLAGQPVRHAVVRPRVLRRDGGRAHLYLGPVRLQDVDLVFAHLVGADEDAPVAALLGNDGQPDTGVSAGRLDDRAARLEQTLLLGGLDHPQRDPVLHAAARVEVLDLGQHGRLDVGRDVAQPDQRGVADQVSDGLVVVHGGALSRSAAVVVDRPRRSLRPAGRGHPATGRTRGYATTSPSMTSRYVAAGARPRSQARNRSVSSSSDPASQAITTASSSSPGSSRNASGNASIGDTTYPIAAAIRPNRAQVRSV